MPRRPLLCLSLCAGLIGSPALASDAKSLPGMPAVTNSKDIYAADRPNQLSPVVKDFPERVYVPNTNSNTVTVIDPATFKVLKTIAVGRQPQHVVPSWDLKTLWVNNDLGDSLTPINPATGKFGKAIPVRDPYNLYFTPNGKYAVVMASMLHRLDFRDPHTMKLKHSIHVPCAGVNHADWSADGLTFVVSCEFSGKLLLVDTAKMKVIRVARLPGGSMRKPQDVKLSPDGHTYYIADMMADGVWVMSADPKLFGKVHLRKTGMGTHGLYVTRDSKYLLITNRGEGTISVLRFSDKKLVKKWHLPKGASPDMGGISADGKVFWISGRYSHFVYAVSTETGKTLAKIKVGEGPHGLAVYPQPGRYSLGHTGVFR